MFYFQVGTEEHQNYTRILQNIRSMCARNEQNLTQNANKTSKVQETGFPSRCYVNKRKISLTCYNRTIVDSCLSNNQQTIGATPTAHMTMNKLEAKRKVSGRLRSPVPSPSVISPSSSPNRSRFQVFRVSEPCAASSTVKLVDGSPVVNMRTPSPLSPLTGIPNNSASIVSVSKSLSSSPRSRFQVCRIYEDTKVPLDQRALPPITPPINPPPTPLSKTVPNETAQLLSNSTTSMTTIPITTFSASTITVTTATPISTTTTTLIKVVDFMPDTITIEPNMKANNAAKTPNATTIDIEKREESVETDVSETSSSSPSTSSTSSTRSSVSPTLQPTLTTTNYVGNFFEDNDATITETSGNYIKTPSPVHTDMTDSNDNHKQSDIQAIMTTEQNARKTSWIANPATVDKLLNIFQNPGAFFQHHHNESQETKDDNVPTTTTSVQAFHPSDCTLLSSFPVHKSMQWQMDNFPLSPSSTHGKESSSTVPWCSNGAEIAKTLATTAAAATLVQSRSFLDNASRQFKDLGKQMFGTTFPMSGDKKLEAVAEPQQLTQPKEIIEIKTDESSENCQD